MVPFVPLPYLLVVVLLSGNLNPLLLGLAAGAGGAIGKVTSYLLGRFGYRVAGNATQENIDALHGVLSRYGALGVFVFSVTPLPDDVYVIPMGIIRLPFWRFFIANLAGKVVLSVAVAYLGRQYLASLSVVLGDSLLAMAEVVIVTVALSLLVMKADWVSAVKILRTRGIRGLVVSLPDILRLRRNTRK